MSEAGIWIIDTEAKTVYANARMAEILGTSCAAMIGESSLDFVYPEDAAAAQKLFDGKREGNSAPFRFRLKRKDGVSVWTDVQGTPMFEPSGKFTGIVGTFVVVEES